MEFIHCRHDGHGTVSHDASRPRVLRNDVVRGKRSHVGPTVVGLSGVAADFDADLVQTTEFTLSERYEHVGKARSDANVPQHDARAGR